MFTHVFWKFDKNLIEFSYEDHGKFSKSLSVFWKNFNLKLVENLVEFSFENFDILTKICICENMWGIFEMIMSFGNLIKTLLGFLMEILANFLKTCLFYENLVEFSLENFDILIKFCICENMLGILGMNFSYLLEIW